jgi:hypothetical protein
METLTPARRYVHMSVRLPLSLKEALRSEAAIRGLNVNSLIEMVLTKFTTYDIIAEYNSSVQMNASLFKNLLNRASQEDMKNMGRALGPVIVKQAFDFLGYSHDMNIITERYFKPVGSFSGWYKFNTIYHDQRQILLFSHEYGLNWSSFLAEYVSGVVRSMGGTIQRAEVADSLVTVNV